MEMLATYRNEDEAGMRLDPGLVALTPEAEAADDGRDNKLRGQDGVDLANELVADVDSGLGYGAAKLEVIGDVVFTAARLAAAKKAIGILSAAGCLV